LSFLETSLLRGFVPKRSVRQREAITCGLAGSSGGRFRPTTAARDSRCPQDASSLNFSPPSMRQVWARPEELSWPSGIHARSSSCSLRHHQGQQGRPLAALTAVQGGSAVRVSLRRSGPKTMLGRLEVAQQSVSVSGAGLRADKAGDTLLEIGCLVLSSGLGRATNSRPHPGVGRARR
jgi:hypothetical protein